VTSTDKDYAAAAEWAEHDMRLPENSSTALRGEPAAAYGRSVLERALGGRPSIDPAAGPGEHSRVRQVRLPQALNAELDAVAQQQHRTASEVLRDAIAEYLATRHAS
jgi:hypothetical protein